MEMNGASQQKSDRNTKVGNITTHNQQPATPNEPAKTKDQHIIQLRNT